jgi:hypothetical protein
MSTNINYTANSVYTQTISTATPPTNVPHVNKYINLPSNPVSNLHVSNKLITNTNKKFSMKSIFSDNAAEYYKQGSLIPGGIGSVLNSRHKSKNT